MKKVNKIAAEDAVRYIQAKKTLAEINKRAWNDVKYADAVDAAVERIENNATSIAIAQKAGPSLARKLQIGALIGVGVIILHETGYDEVIWNKLTRWAKRTKSTVEEKTEELKEQHPYAAEAARNVADTAKTAATDIKDTAKDAYLKETGSSHDEPVDPKGTVYGGPTGDVRRPTQGPYTGGSFPR